ncbi:hypothetical protein EZS27_016468 [termite gut metagenome]|uniref:Uncharacterized protein n=1 Tax=termite gut metagenome TaxID=433724 RepID=A0A5J4RQR9_9ZZZZ
MFSCKICHFLCRWLNFIYKWGVMNQCISRYLHKHIKGRFQSGNVIEMNNSQPVVHLANRKKEVVRHS